MAGKKIKTLGEARAALAGSDAKARRYVRNFSTDRELRDWMKATRAEAARQGREVDFKVSGPYADGPKWSASRVLK